jgi:gamma-glutamyltranspeptidase/glutathione hydrolase
MVIMMPVYASLSDKGGIASQAHFATLEGLKILENGGNAFDAAIAVSALLSVIIPNTGSVGGDGFLIALGNNGKLIAYNGSGRSPRELCIDDYLANETVRGPQNVTVPGLVDLWEWVNENYGSKDLGLLLHKAISLARDGFYAQENFVRSVETARPELDKFEGWNKLFGHVELGSWVCYPRLATVYSVVARRGADAFYRSKLTENIVEGLRQQGVPITCEDFAEHEGEKVSPVKCDYGDYDLFEFPPNSQGLSTLQLLKAVEVTELNELPFGSPQRVKEFFKLAVKVYEDRDKYIADPDWFKPPVNQLLSPQYLRKRLCKEPHSQHILKPNDTTNFVVGDKCGNIVGFIQSLFHSFGSGIVAQDIPFQSRGAGFARSLGLSNSPAPGKRPLHTLSILVARHCEYGDYIIGCAGGDLRPQVDSEVFMNLADYNMPLSRALEAPRYILTSWRKDELKANIENAFWSHEMPQWADRVGFQSERMGIVHAMNKRPDGALELAADPRGGGVALALL